MRAQTIVGELRGLPRATMTDAEITREAASRVLLMQEAAKRGLVVSDAEVEKAIRSHRAFADPHGQFYRPSYTRYLSRLSERGVSEALYRETIHDQMTINRLSDAVTVEKIQPNEAELMAAYHGQYGKIIVDVVQFLEKDTQDEGGNLATDGTDGTDEKGKKSFSVPSVPSVPSVAASSSLPARAGATGKADKNVGAPARAEMMAKRKRVHWLTAERGVKAVAGVRERMAQGQTFEAACGELGLKVQTLAPISVADDFHPFGSAGQIALASLKMMPGDVSDYTRDVSGGYFFRLRTWTPPPPEGLDQHRDELTKLVRERKRAQVWHEWVEELRKESRAPERQP